MISGPSFVGVLLNSAAPDKPQQTKLKIAEPAKREIRPVLRADTKASNIKSTTARAVTLSGQLSRRLILVPAGKFRLRSLRLMPFGRTAAATAQAILTPAVDPHPRGVERYKRVAPHSLLRRHVDGLGVDQERALPDPLLGRHRLVADDVLPTTVRAAKRHASAPGRGSSTRRSPRSSAGGTCST